MIIWAGTSNKDIGMVVEHYPSVVLPRRSQEVQQVPGRNGAVLLSYGSFENYEQKYSVFLDAAHIGKLEQVMPKLVDWLLGHDGYHRLEDSYFPDVYRMAYYSGGTEFVSMFNEYGEGTLVFTCAPERFYKIGERTIDLQNGNTITNPSSFLAEPLITINGSGSGSITFNGKTVNITDIGTSVTIDVKQHKAYSGSQNRNNTISGSFESLKLEKETTISWTGGVGSVSMIPRWWTI